MSNLASKRKALGSEQGMVDNPTKYLNVAVITASEEDSGNVVDGSQVYKWSVSFQSADESVSLEKYVEKIILQLHESFAVPKRVLKTPPYVIKEEGWGEFNIGVTIYFKDQGVAPLKFMHPLSFESNYLRREVKTSCKLSMNGGQNDQPSASSTQASVNLDVGTVDGATIELLANRLCQLDNVKIKDVVQMVQKAKYARSAIIAHHEPKETEAGKERDGIFTFDLYALEEQELLDLCHLVGLERSKSLAH
jgi:transcription initiation factor IIF auxiliary subunit